MWPYCLIYILWAKAIREVDEQTLIFYEPVTWGYFSPMQNNKILDMLLVNAMDSSSIFAMTQGIQILRIHDVNEIIQSIKVFKELNK